MYLYRHIYKLHIYTPTYFTVNQICFKIRLGANHETSRYFPDNNILWMEKTWQDKEKMNYMTTVK